MKALESVLGVQLKAMVDSGVSIEDAAEILNLDADAAKDFIFNDYGNKEITSEELIKKYKPQMIQVLADIALDSSIENVAARVSAAKVFVEGKGEIPEIPVDKLSNAYKQMRDVITKQNQKPTTISNPSSSTTIVDVNMPLSQAVSGVVDLRRPESPDGVKTPLDQTNAT